MSYTYGTDVVADFLAKFDFDLVVRAHQVVENGYEFFGKRQLVTVFSAPNYCGEFDNAGAMMTVDENLMCSFQILKPAERKLMGGFGSMMGSRPSTPPARTRVASSGEGAAGSAAGRARGPTVRHNGPRDDCVALPGRSVSD